MKKLLTSIFFMVFICGLNIALRAQTNASLLLITATPAAATVHPGDTVKFDVVITNTGASDQKIDVRNFWWAVTDSSQIVIPGWPRFGGIGPAVSVRSVTIAPGAAFKRSWNARVSATAEPGEVMLRVGVPLNFRSEVKTWSEPVPMKIIAQEPVVAVANPLYAAWQGQAGQTVTFNRTESISGGAPMPGGGSRALPAQAVQFTLSDFTAGQAVVKVITDSNQPADTLVIPATLMPNDPALPKSAGTETLHIGAQTYACTKYTYYTSSQVELGRDPQGLRGQVTVWVAAGVPGGIVQRHVSLTIRASYDLTDTLAVRP